MEIIKEEEFYEAMKKISNELHDIYYDKERIHIEMDNLMCELLTTLGYGRAIEIFKSTPKWYA